MPSGRQLPLIYYRHSFSKAAALSPLCRHTFSLSAPAELSQGFECWFRSQDQLKARQHESCSHTLPLTEPFSRFTGYQQMPTLLEADSETKTTLFRHYTLNVKWATWLRSRKALPKTQWYSLWTKDTGHIQNESDSVYFYMCCS